MRAEHYEVAELVSAFEGLHERLSRLDATSRDANIDLIERAIDELGRHGVEALPIMEAAHRRLEVRIAHLERDAVGRRASI